MWGDCFFTADNARLGIDHLGFTDLFYGARDNLLALETYEYVPRMPKMWQPKSSSNRNPARSACNFAKPCGGGVPGDVGARSERHGRWRHCFGGNCWRDRPAVVAQFSKMRRGSNHR